MAVSKLCPATWELTLIFISKAFWKEEIPRKRENRWAEKERKTVKEHVCTREKEILSVSACVCARLCVAHTGNCERFRPQPKLVRAGQT